MNFIKNLTAILLEKSSYLYNNIGVYKFDIIKYLIPSVLIFMELMFHTSFIDNATISEIWTGLMASMFCFAGIIYMVYSNLRTKFGDLILLTFGFIFLYMHIIVYITQDVLGLNQHLISLVLYVISFLSAKLIYEKITNK